MNQIVSNVTKPMFFIYGPSGSGKSSLGRLLAECLALPFCDLDKEIEARSGMTIADIFTAEGEPGFRLRERAALQEALGRGSGVVALGGGALLDAENRSRVEAVGSVLCLTADVETLAQRVQSGGDVRPLLANPASDDDSDRQLQARLSSLLERRAEHYNSFSLKLDTSHLTLEKALDEAQVKLGFFHVGGKGNASRDAEGYDVRVQPGGLDSLGELLMQRGLKGPIALVSDDTVAPLYAGRAAEALRRSGYTVRTVCIPAGEQHKTLETVTRLLEAFLEAELERGSTVVALGGGVVTDLAGFASAIYLRGVRWVAVPTSLLGMTDASLGGKTGADLPQGKNLVGAFHSPRLVLADPQVLKTLPAAELRSGMAEVLKHGIISDPALFARCAQGNACLQAQDADWSDTVRRAMAVKVRVIQADPFEKGERAVLNLGHTIGHGIERAADFRLRHGECIAIGLALEACLAERIGLAQAGTAAQIIDALRGLGLPVEMPSGLDREEVLQAIQFDKKRAAGKVLFTLPLRVGEARWGIPVELTLVNEMLDTKER